MCFFLYFSSPIESVLFYAVTTIHNLLLHQVIMSAILILIMYVISFDQTINNSSNSYSI